MYFDQNLPDFVFRLLRIDLPRFFLNRRRCRDPGEVPLFTEGREYFLFDLGLRLLADFARLDYNTVFNDSSNL